MIPKILHRAFFPPWKPSPLSWKCWASWKKNLPDYTFMEWRVENVPKTEWAKAAVEQQSPNLFSYMRFWALANYGGVFMDNDVEVLKPFDLSHGAFCGFQRDDTETDCVNVAVLASEPEHPLVRDLLAAAARRVPSDHPLAFGPSLITNVLRRSYGLRGLNVEQTLPESTLVYSKEKLYPWRWDEKPDMERVTPETFAIHWWEGSWAPNQL